MIFLNKSRKGISSKNLLVGSYIYGSRGVSPGNILVGSIFYDDERQEPKKLYKSKEQHKVFFLKKAQNGR